MAYKSATSTIDGQLMASMDLAQTNDYWNIDDILAEEETIPTQFKIQAPGLGFLD
eukprot:CAMPEP_0202960570 /NCGR_PEP_ID=MMETSP1396-20130829/4720_1 /ASSEMBLY_ACC=CAM_ASM_000872 /TAXON_ID= /ORGANISM="Pseudokeronopsis sp., Strain Brazil" /LENGTH=54 /DNA_ID=CAMNT_0049679869 /DNA_START=1 /DNA_END=165 /DNA_ORIENTATION=+